MNRSHALSLTAAAMAPLVAIGTFAAVRAAEAHSATSASDQTQIQVRPQQPSDWALNGTTPYGTLGGSEVTPAGPGAGTTSTVGQATSAQSAGVVLINTSVDFGRAAAAGTGLVIGSNGIVVTNHHVVAGATTVTVTDPSTGTTYPATVVGYDSTHDVAVLRLQGASGLRTVTTDPTNSIGESVTSVGNAEGRNVLTAATGSILRSDVGIDVTQDDGSTTHLSGLIENSADVVQGDSGGALLDDDGEVVGMNVAASSGSTRTTGYAIPIAEVLSIANQILAGQPSSTVTLGAPAGLGVAVATYNGAFVQGVVRNGAAAAAGITAGDTITELGTDRINSAQSLIADLKKLAPGESLAIAWTDSSGAEHRATVTLGQGPIG